MIFSFFFFLAFDIIFIFCLRKQVLEDAKLKQKYRQRHAQSVGLKVSSRTGLPEGFKPKHHKTTKKDDSGRGGDGTHQIVQDEIDRRWGLQEAMNFTKEKTLSQIEKKMAEFIEKKMEERGFSSSKASAAQASSSSSSASSSSSSQAKLSAKEQERSKADEILYSTPENLKIPQIKGENSANRWLTGLEEIELPVEYKIKNIEETERITEELRKKEEQKKALLAQSSSDFSSASSTLANALQSNSKTCLSIPILYIYINIYIYILTFGSRSPPPHF